MKFEVIKCPSCGSSELKINNEQATCSHCQTNFLVKKEVNAKEQNLTFVSNIVKNVGMTVVILTIIGAIVFITITILIVSMLMRTF